MKKVVYPGSFDPITLGHLNIIERASEIFDEVVVLILKNINKPGYFKVDERKEFIELSIKKLSNVKVDISEDLLITYLKKHKISTVLKGIRNQKDLEYEYEMATINRILDPKIDTVFLLTEPEYLVLSSSNVRELIAYEAPLKGFVPDVVIERIGNKHD